MYNRRVSKTDPRVGSYGSVDELNVALGWVRCQESSGLVRESVERVQDQLVVLMGELATAPEDRERYRGDGFTLVDASFVEPIDALVIDLEGRNLSFKGWAKPGDNPGSAALDMARCACRRAERAVCALIESDLEPNTEIARYLNRLSDALWLLARWIETGRPEVSGDGAKA